jgi:hypothetical protein
MTGRSSEAPPPIETISGRSTYGSNPEPAQQPHAVLGSPHLLAPPDRFHQAVIKCQRFIDERIDANATNEDLWSIDDDRWQILRRAAQTVVDQCRADAFAERAMLQMTTRLQTLDDLWQNVRNRRAILSKRSPHRDHYRTGVPGKPTSRQLVQGELERRAATRQLEGTLRAEAEYLEKWLRATHKDAPPMTARTIENALRNLYRTLTSP